MDNHELHTLFLTYTYNVDHYFHNMLERFRKHLSTFDQKIEKENVLCVVNQIEIYTRHLMASMILDECKEVISYIENHGDETQKALLNQLKVVHSKLQEKVDQAQNIPKE